MPALETAVPLTLRVRELSRTLGGRRVLDGATLQVRPGTIVGLLGPNGAGKSSMLRVIAGRLRPDTGEVIVAGLAPRDATRQGRIGLVPQDIALFPHLTVAENLAVLGRLAGVPAAALLPRVTEALAWAGLSDRADAIVTTLSGGMRRRVNLVAATLHRPALLLLDEPAVGVDAEARVRLHDLLRSLCEQGMGLLLTTHDADEAASLCDEVAVMVAGRVVMQAPVARLVSETFGHAREVSIVVTTPVPAPAVAVLEAEQFRPVGGGRWVGSGDGRLADLDRLQARLRAAGIGVTETRVSEPRLDSAVALLLARHQGATA